MERKVPSSKSSERASLMTWGTINTVPTRFLRLKVWGNKWIHQLTVIKKRRNTQNQIKRLNYWLLLSRGATKEGFLAFFQHIFSCTSGKATQNKPEKFQPGTGK